jgi:aryl-alcohol dehydrogenase
MSQTTLTPIEVKVAVLREASGKLQLERAELAVPRADEVRVRVVATGVCHTDMVVLDQLFPTPLPIILGHVGAGVVEAVGAAVTTIAPGDHMVMPDRCCMPATLGIEPRRDGVDRMSIKTVEGRCLLAA